MQPRAARGGGVEQERSPRPSPRPHRLTPAQPAPSTTAQPPFPIPGTFPSRRPLQ